MAKGKRLKLFFSPDILSEVKTALSYPKLKKLHKKSPRWIERFLKELSDQAIITAGDLMVQAVKEDPSDNIHLACALEGQATLLFPATAASPT